jgi:DNA-directed RNA polymerase subunit RPC12/RpoP
MPISSRTYFWGEKAKNAPEEPGVYALYDKDNVLIFIGASSNLREEFLNSLQTGFTKNLCKSSVKFYKRETTPNPEERKKELLEEFRQKHGQYPKCHAPSTNIETATIMPTQSFYFYMDLDKPLNETSSDLDEFKAKVSKIPVSSLEFHQERGDFTRWINTVIKNHELAELIKGISKSGEDLREEILNAINFPEKAECPKCGDRVNAVKTWKMAGKPSKAGQRLQLTIGFYKCNNCKKSFRQVLSKKKIQA